MPANDETDVFMGIVEWLTPAQYDRALRRMEAKWGFELPDEAVFKRTSTYAETEAGRFSTDDVVSRIYDAARAAGRVPPPRPGEGAENELPGVLVEMRASLARSLGEDAVPAVLSPEATLRTLIPRRRRRTLKRLSTDLGTDLGHGVLGPAGCWSCAALATLIFFGAIWFVGAWMDRGFGFAFVAGVLAISATVFLFAVVHGVWRRWHILPITVGALALKTAEERAERLQRRHFSADAYRLLADALDDDSGDAAEMESQKESPHGRGHGET